MKAILLTKVRENQIGGDSILMNDVQDMLKEDGIEIGYLHSIHQIHFENTLTYAIRIFGKDKPSQCYLITLNAEPGSIKLFYIKTRHGLIIRTFFIDEQEVIHCPIYEKCKAGFIMLPDEEELKEFLCSVPFENYESPH